MINVRKFAGDDLDPSLLDEMWEDPLGGPLGGPLGDPLDASEIPLMLSTHRFGQGQRMSKKPFKNIFDQ